MNRLVKQVMCNAELSEAQAKKAVETIVDFLKASLSDPIPSQIDVVLAGTNVREQVSKMFGAIGAPVDPGDPEVVELILAQGVDPNMKNSVGETPLHVAAFWGRYEIAKLLIDHGANIDAKDSNDNTALRKAAEAINANPHVVDLLLEAGATVDLFSACLMGDEGRVLPMLTTPDAVNARDSAGNTPLHMAAKKGRKEVAELLISKGADIDAKNDLDATPLSLAIHDCGDDAPIVALLRQHGAVE